MRYATGLWFTLMLTACDRSPVPRGDSPPANPAVVEFLLASAATDFHTHRPPDPVGFREVRTGHIPSPTGDALYLLCGQFLPAQGAEPVEWTPFVTIKTSGYEQYIGGQVGEGYCGRAEVVWDPGGDLGPELKRRLDSLRQGTAGP